MRDVLDPADLVTLIDKQMAGADAVKSRVLNVAGGIDNSLSLAELSEWCAERFGPRPVGKQPREQVYDVPWVVLDPRCAARVLDWRPETPVSAILTAVADFADDHPGWLESVGDARR